jgi:hypothetical protein
LVSSCVGGNDFWWWTQEEKKHLDDRRSPGGVRTKHILVRAHLAPNIIWSVRRPYKNAPNLQELHITSSRRAFPPAATEGFPGLRAPPHHIARRFHRFVRGVPSLHIPRGSSAVGIHLNNIFLSHINHSRGCMWAFFLFVSSSNPNPRSWG